MKKPTIFTTTDEKNRVRVDFANPEQKKGDLVSGKNNGFLNIDKESKTEKNIAEDNLGIFRKKKRISESKLSGLKSQESSNYIEGIFQEFGTDIDEDILEQRNNENYVVGGLEPEKIGHVKVGLLEDNRKVEEIDNLPATVDNDEYLLKLLEQISAEEDEKLEIIPENLPEIINRAVVESGEFDLEPDWYMVKDTPGYVYNGIRRLGSMIFSNYTNLPLDEINILCTLTNNDEEVKGMMAWIVENGELVCNDDLKFERIMPGYSPKVQLWAVEGYSFLLVKDHEGHYIYGWPGGNNVKLNYDKENEVIPKLGRF